MDEKKPEATRLKDVKTQVFRDGLFTNFLSNEVWDLGMYFMEPGLTTIVFSMENEDDGTAEEWYGPIYEFYLIITGEFTVWYGHDAEKLRKKEGPNIVLLPGDVMSYVPGLKYIVQNTGNIPGTFFWGMSASPEGVVKKEIEVIKTIE